MFWNRKPDPTKTTDEIKATATEKHLGQYPPASVPIGRGDGDAPIALPTAPVHPADYFNLYGFPNVVHDLAIRGEFVSYFDRRMRNPWWVVEHITAESLSNSRGNRGQSVFAEDNMIPDKFKAKLKDYFRSGYDRGHLAPAADAKYSQDAMNETFYLSNMCPQIGEGFNRDYWAHFEYFVRQLTNKYESVRVVTGPLYLPKREADGKWRVSYEMIGNPPNVAVPTHFYKIIVGENPIGIRGVQKGTVAVGAFVLPNARIDNSTPLKSFYVPVEMIERSSGVDFLPKLALEQRRDLCREVTCEITVREFNNAVKSLPAPKRPLGLPEK